MARQTLTVPDIGGAEDAEVIEVSVAVGDAVELEQGLMVLESDKASMEIPADFAGTVLEVLVSEGDALKEGDAIVVLETADAETSPAEDNATEEQVSQDAAAEPATEPEEPAETPATTANAATESTEQDIVVPDIGTDEAVEVIEISAATGDQLEEGDTVIVLESDKASMEMPAPFAGELVSLSVKEGDQVRQGDLVGVMRSATSAAAAVSATEPTVAPQSEPQSEPEADSPASPQAPAITAPPAPAAQTTKSDKSEARASDVYAGPAVRKLARELGVSLEEVRGTGPKGRILKEDLQEYVKRVVQGGGTASTGAGVPPVPEIDYAAFGSVQTEPMTKIDKVTAANMHRSWLNVPHVTQFSEADVTALEDFRASLKPEAEKRGVRLTPLPFLLKACAKALADNPRLNRAISGKDTFVYRQYTHIGMAVDTPAGLVVPVIRDVDKKSLWELAAETADLAERAKNRKLKPADMQGACFTISSLGGLGGTGFTPIVNSPEVAILGVSKLSVKPVWDGDAFQPRKMLPLSLSYDHRAVNGADGGRFSTQLCELLADIRRLLL